MVAFSPTNMLFFTSLFFLTMLPMDPPQKKGKRKIIVDNKIKTPSDVSIAWEDFDKKQEQLGACFAILPKEILYPYFLIESEPSVKNGLRKTNKALTELLSWEKMQPFMVCPSLCASQEDIKSIIIQLLYPYTGTNKQFIPSEKQGLIQSLGKKLTTFSYPIEGCINNRSERFELELALSNLSTPLLFISDHQGSIIGSTDVYAIISPLLIACIARNPHTVENCLKSLNSLRNEDFERSLHILVKNDDVQSLNLLLNTKKITNISFDLSSKLCQLALLFPSPNVINTLKAIHQRHTILMHKSGMVTEEKDYLASWLNTPDKKGGCNLRSIVQMNHIALSEKHKNNITRYHECLNNMCSKKVLKNFNPPVEIMNARNSNKTEDKKDNEKCIIS